MEKYFVTKIEHGKISIIHNADFLTNGNINNNKNECLY